MAFISAKMKLYVLNFQPDWTPCVSFGAQAVIIDNGSKVLLPIYMIHADS